MSNLEQRWWIFRQRQAESSRKPVGGHLPQEQNTMISPENLDPFGMRSLIPTKFTIPKTSFTKEYLQRLQEVVEAKQLEIEPFGCRLASINIKDKVDSSLAGKTPAEFEVEIQLPPNVVRLGEYVKLALDAFKNERRWQTGEGMTHHENVSERTDTSGNIRHQGDRTYLGQLGTTLLGALYVSVELLREVGRCGLPRPPLRLFYDPELNGPNGPKDVRKDRVEAPDLPTIIDPWFGWLTALNQHPCVHRPHSEVEEANQNEIRESTVSESRLLKLLVNEIFVEGVPVEMIEQKDLAPGFKHIIFVALAIQEGKTINLAQAHNDLAGYWVNDLYYERLVSLK